MGRTGRTAPKLSLYHGAGRVSFVSREASLGSFRSDMAAVLSQPRPLTTCGTATPAAAAASDRIFQAAKRESEFLWLTIFSCPGTGYGAAGRPSDGIALTGIQYGTITPAYHPHPFGLHVHSAWSARQPDADPRRMFKPTLSVGGDVDCTLCAVSEFRQRAGDPNHRISAGAVAFEGPRNKD
ncbi:unnamed protein product [Mycena citricolor]|uniref:Uncharacterized protein n=1 Tax=Mycena citricolor TaxID=2018698 RepID=A0AAD2K6D9_9AGAR|nr:unnamed protein product [Mycena citricolor]